MFSFRLFKQSKTLVAVLCFVLNSLAFTKVNLIPNSSFEDSISVPNDLSQINKCKYWFVTVLIPDYYSVLSPLSPSMQNVSIPLNLAGFQNTKKGRCSTGIITKLKSVFPNSPKQNIFEIIQVDLQQNLLKDHIYDYTMHYSLADGSGIACNQLQAYFTGGNSTFFQQTTT